jgi:uncharacterized protein YecE (DUF72 family)
MPRTGRLRIGISGWNYKPWRGRFYPQKLPEKQELAYASSLFPTIEINGTFYSQQRPDNFARWAAETPEGFVFAVKAPRYLTHMLRLKNVGTPLANFFASGLLRLGPKLGPILWQLPPNFRFDPERLAAFFFAMLPRDTEAAVRLARRHDRKLRGRTWLTADRHRPLRHALEVRHDSLRTPEFIALLRRHDIALVCADAVDWPRLMDVTSDFVYCRLHGSELYAGGYDKPALRRWAARIRTWRHGGQPREPGHLLSRTAPRHRPRDVYVYFDNDAKVRAPGDVQCLRQLAGA